MKSSIDIQSWLPMEFPKENLEDSSESEEIVELERILSIFGKTGNVEYTREKAENSNVFYYRDAAAWEPGDISQFVVQGVDEVSSPEMQKQDGSALSSLFHPAAKPGYRQDLTLKQNPASVVEDAYLQAEQIIASRLAEAKKEADDMLQQAVSQRDEIIQKAHDEGYAQGVAKVGTAVQAAQEMLGQFLSWRQEMISNSERDILGLVKEIATGLFGEGFGLDSSILQQTFSRILLSARALGDLRLYVNPEDAKLLDPAWREYQVLISGQRIQILPTEAIRQGGCYLEGQRGSVDARIETQLRAMLNEGLSLDDEVPSEDGED